jgi:hypothetical protein
MRLLRDYVKLTFQEPKEREDYQPLLSKHIVYT